MAHTPLIGITVGTGSPSPANGLGLRLRSTYPRAVASGGGAPVLIPLDIDELALRSVYRKLDGLIISGGGDVDPATYGHLASPYTTSVNDHRDSIELNLIRWAIADGKPLLGICRGHQILNVALGGTLVQNIDTEVENALPHNGPTDDWFVRLPHHVQIVGGSKLHIALNVIDTVLAVNSMHHQAVRELGEGLMVTAHADDGIVESIELANHPFALGVQWHPEALFEIYPPHRALFVALVKAAELASVH